MSTRATTSADDPRLGRAVRRSRAHQQTRAIGGAESKVVRASARDYGKHASGSKSIDRPSNGHRSHQLDLSHRLYLRKYPSAKSPINRQPNTSPQISRDRAATARLDAQTEKPPWEQASLGTDGRNAATKKTRPKRAAVARYTLDRRTETAQSVARRPHKLLIVCLVSSRFDRPPIHCDG